MDQEKAKAIKKWIFKVGLYVYVVYCMWRLPIRSNLDIVLLIVFIAFFAVLLFAFPWYKLVTDNT